VFQQLGFFEIPTYFIVATSHTLLLLRKAEMDVKYTNNNKRCQRCVTSHLTVLDELDSVRGQVNRELQRNAKMNEEEISAVKLEEKQQILVWYFFL
jgi:hypothetical protein